MSAGACAAMALHPDVDAERLCEQLAAEGADGGGHELDLVLGVGVEPVVDLLVEVLHRVVAELGDEGLDVDRALTGDVGLSLPTVFVRLALTQGVDVLAPGPDIGGSFRLCDFDRLEFVAVVGVGGRGLRTRLAVVVFFLDRDRIGEQVVVARAGARAGGMALTGIGHTMTPCGEAK
ncbi:UNVERIFIED_CONTAM: hypothetical protein BEN50_25260 [Euhalothece sp. KZN 001]